MSAKTTATRERVVVRRKTMQAAVISAPRRLEIREVPLPEPGPGHVRIRMEGCGVCTSNLPPWEGRPWFEYPMAPGNLGHEGWGTIDAVGSGVDHLELGQRVSSLSTLAYAQCTVSAAEDVIPLPDVLGDRPFPGEPLACAMNVFERADVRAGQRVAIVGVGFLGAILTRLATVTGAQVFAVSRRRYALDVAQAFGATRTVPMQPPDVVERVREWTNGRMCERVIEAAGKQETLDLAAELAGEYGRLVIAGYHQDGLRQVNMQSWNWRGLDVINAHERDPERYRNGVYRAIDAVVAGRIDPEPLYTHRFSLSDLDQALETVRRRPDGFMKALVIM